MTRQEIYDILINGVHTVTFTKVDGTERIMPCTLDPAILPQQIVEEDRKAPRKLNADTMRVFVTDVNEWRSFRIANVISVD